jgi:hypothetical protein
MFVRIEAFVLHMIASKRSYLFTKLQSRIKSLDWIINSGIGKMSNILSGLTLINLRKVIILSDNYRLSYPVGSFVLTSFTHPTAYTRCGLAAWSDKGFCRKNMDLV